MSVIVPNTTANDANAGARRRLLAGKWEPLFVADWERAVFIHYEVDARLLQWGLPFALDLRDGKAYVSLVAFTMRGMRPRFGGRIGAWLFAPISTHEFLNVRAYVRYRDEPGILFLTEWLPNRLSVRLGPMSFGLPYQHGRLNYEHAHENGCLRGRVAVPGTAGGLCYEAEIRRDAPFHVCAPGSLDEFLLERYAAFTCRAAVRRQFRIWHPPWPQARVDVKVHESSLLSRTFEWFRDARPAGSHYSPGLRDVWMGWPHRIGGHRGRRGSGTLSAVFELP